jgi:hypothetical protein
MCFTGAHPLMHTYICAYKHYKVDKYVLQSIENNILQSNPSCCIEKSKQNKFLLCVTKCKIKNIGIRHNFIRHETISLKAFRTYKT